MDAIKFLVCILALIFVCLQCTDCIQHEQVVYLQKPSITDYLYKYDLPALTDFTYCMWLNFAHGLDDIYPISISSIADDNHHLYAFLNLKSTPIIGHYGSSGGRTDGLSADVVEAIMFGWHKHCFVYKNNVHASWYLDRDTPGVLMEMNTGAAQGTIPEGSALILLQEQDSFKGSLSLGQVGYGKFSMFNMWDYAMTLDELNGLGCHDKGIVTNMDDLEMMGSLETITEEFQCPDVTAAKLEKRTNTMMFCIKNGQQLPDVFYKTITTVSETDCAKQCAYDVKCNSANFLVDSQVCQLNPVGEDVQTVNLEAASGVILLSSVDCSQTLY